MQQSPYSAYAHNGYGHHVAHPAQHDPRASGWPAGAAAPAPAASSAPYPYSPRGHAYHSPRYAPPPPQQQQQGFPHRRYAPPPSHPPPHPAYSAYDDYARYNSPSPQPPMHIHAAGMRAAAVPHSYAAQPSPRLDSSSPPAAAPASASTSLHGGATGAAAAQPAPHPASAATATAAVASSDLPPSGMTTRDFLKARIKLAEDSIRKLHAATPTSGTMPLAAPLPSPSPSPAHAPLAAMPYPPLHHHQHHPPPMHMIRSPVHAQRYAYAPAPAPAPAAVLSPPPPGLARHFSPPGPAFAGVPHSPAHASGFAPGPVPAASPHSYAMRDPHDRSSHSSPRVHSHPSAQLAQGRHSSPANGRPSSTRAALEAEAEADQEDDLLWREAEEARRRRRHAEADLAEAEAAEERVRRQRDRWAHDQQQQRQRSPPVLNGHSRTEAASAAASGDRNEDAESQSDSDTDSSVALIMRVSMDHGVVDLVVPLDAEPLELAERFCREQGLELEKVHSLAASIHDHLDMLRRDETLQAEEEEQMRQEQERMRQRQEQREQQQQLHDTKRERAPNTASATSPEEQPTQRRLDPSPHSAGDVVADTGSRSRALGQGKDRTDELHPDADADADADDSSLPATHRAPHRDEAHVDAGADAAEAEEAEAEEVEQEEEEEEEMEEVEVEVEEEVTDDGDDDDGSVLQDPLEPEKDADEEEAYPRFHDQRGPHATQEAEEEEQGSHSAHTARAHRRRSSRASSRASSTARTDADADADPPATERRAARPGRSRSIQRGSHGRRLDSLGRVSVAPNVNARSISLLRRSARKAEAAAAAAARARATSKQTTARSASHSRSQSHDRTERDDRYSDADEEHEQRDDDGASQGGDSDRDGGASVAASGAGGPAAPYTGSYASTVARLPFHERLHLESQMRSLHLSELQRAREAELDSLQRAKKVLRKSRALVAIRAQDLRPIGARLYEDGLKALAERERVHTSTAPSWERAEEASNPPDDLTFRPAISELAHSLRREGAFNFERIVDYDGSERSRRAAALQAQAQARREAELDAPHSFVPVINEVSQELAARRARKEEEARVQIMERMQRFAAAQAQKRGSGLSTPRGGGEEEVKQSAIPATVKRQQQPSSSSAIAASLVQSHADYRTPPLVESIYTDLCTRGAAMASGADPASLPPRVPTGFWQVPLSGVARWHDTSSASATGAGAGTSSSPSPPAPIVSPPLFILSARRFQRAKDIFSVLDSDDRDGIIDAQGAMDGVEKLHPQDQELVAQLLRRIHQAQLRYRAEEYARTEGLQSVEEALERLRESDPEGRPPPPCFKLAFSDFCHLFLHELHLLAAAGSNPNYDLLREPLPLPNQPQQAHLAQVPVLASVVASSGDTAAHASTAPPSRAGSRAGSRRASVTSASGEGRPGSRLLEPTQSSRSRSHSRPQSRAPSRPESRSASRSGSRTQSRSHSRSASLTRVGGTGGSSAAHAPSSLSDLSNGSTLHHLQHLASMPLPSSSSSTSSPAHTSVHGRTAGPPPQTTRSRSNSHSHAAPPSASIFASIDRSDRLRLAYEEQLARNEQKRHRDWLMHQQWLRDQQQAAYEVEEARARTQETGETEEWRGLQEWEDEPREESQAPMMQQQQQRQQQRQQHRQPSHSPTPSPHSAPLMDYSSSPAVQVVLATLADSGALAPPFDTHHQAPAQAPSQAPEQSRASRSTFDTDAAPSLEALAQMSLTGGSITEPSSLASTQDMPPQPLPQPQSRPQSHPHSHSQLPSQSYPSPHSSSFSIEGYPSSRRAPAPSLDGRGSSPANWGASTGAPAAAPSHAGLQMSQAHRAALRHLASDPPSHHTGATGPNGPTHMHVHATPHATPVQMQQQYQRQQELQRTQRRAEGPQHHPLPIASPRSASSGNGSGSGSVNARVVQGAMQVARQHFPESSPSHVPDVSSRSRALADRARTRVPGLALHDQLHQQAHARKQQQHYTIHAHQIHQQRRFAEENQSPYNQ